MATARIEAVLLFILALNVALWGMSRDIYARWDGVPPPPSRDGALMTTLGDREFSYRTLALLLQNLGGTGVETVPLKDYDYPALGRWFSLLSGLDPVSDHVPTLAAYYFGATRVPGDVAAVVSYLRAVGHVPLPEKWRWLAQAAYLAQHRMYDVPLALKIANELAQLPDSAALPQWARQMPAFVLAKKGDKEAAWELIRNILLTDKNLHPEEINTLKAVLVERLGYPPEKVDAIIREREAH